MATLAGAQGGARIPDIEQRERGFFMAMAVLLALTVLLLTAFFLLTRKND